MVPCRLCPFKSQVLKYLKLWEALDIAALVATISKSSAQLAVAAQKHAGSGNVQQSEAILLLLRIVAGPFQSLSLLTSTPKHINFAQRGRTLSCCTSEVRRLVVRRLVCNQNALCGKHAGCIVKSLMCGNGQQGWYGAQDAG